MRTSHQPSADSRTGRVHIYREVCPQILGRCSGMAGGLAAAGVLALAGTAEAVANTAPWTGPYLYVKPGDCGIVVGSVQTSDGAAMGVLWSAVHSSPATLTARRTS